MPATDARDLEEHSPTEGWSFPYASVPDPDDDAEIDPHWLSLRGDSILPTVYMPPAMAGEHAAWTRLMALVLVAVFIAATTAGICLTYGPPHRLF
jgi:hypothetical protein